MTPEGSFEDIPPPRLAFGNLARRSFFGVAVLAVLLFVFISASVVVVKPGHRGVLLNSGTVSPNVLYEGRHFKIPVYQKIVQMDVRV
ncbi:MAG: SPFH domain-containing protein, partial [Syntrophorhabdaceae bacterium]|nr:SPFH domain-containing protein [Syntrophorhabdaceae bacterium]